MDPITRKEQYLNAIAGGDNDVPETPQTREEWFLNQILENGGGGDPETIKEAVEEWLDEHIDPTTGYAVDDTLSIAGAAADAKAAGDELADVKSALTNIETATATDVNKALSPKTVTNGKVTEWQFKPISGGSGSDDAAPVIIASKSGSVATFADGGDSLPVESLVANIDYVQSGEGTPSPENVRPISGWTGCTVYHSGEDTSDPASISFNWQTEAGTVYGGTLNVITGVLTVTHMGVTFDGNTSESDFGIALLAGYTQISWLPYINIGVTGHVFVSDRLGITYSGGAEYKIWGSDPPRMFMGLPTSVQTIANANTWFASNPTTVVYPLATPQTYQLTPHEVTTLLGANNIWADTGNVAVQYRADTKLYVDEHSGSGGDVSDVQISGVSIVSNGVANIESGDLDFVTPVSGATPTITAVAGMRYVCGEVSTIAITTPASGIVDVIFESGSTPAVLTVTPPTGVTAVKWANGFDPTALEANTVYEINIMNGVYGVVASWT